MADLPPDDHSISALIARLIDDAEHFVHAELRLYRAHALTRLRSASLALGLGLSALLLAHAALVTLLVGAVIILRPYVGPIWATVIVVAAALVIVTVMIRIAISEVRKLTRLDKVRRQWRK